jgi:hypothetical protein
MSVLEHLVSLERALKAARLEASRAAEPQIDEILGDLIESVVDLRRRAQRRAEHEASAPAQPGRTSTLTDTMEPSA